jgi:hypothetical protein
MTVEEALVFLLAAAAGLLLFLGLAQALESRPPRRVRPRSRGGELRGRLRAGALAPAPEPSVAGPAPGSAPPVLPPHQPIPLAEPTGALAEAAEVASPVVEEREAGREPEGEPPVAEAAVAAGGSPGGEGDLAFVEGCIGLGLGGKHGELLAAAEPYLGRSADRGPSQPSHVMTALWSLAGLARHGQGDVPGARAAFATALASLPEPASSSCPPRLAALSVSVARRLLEVTERAGEEADEGKAEARILAARLAAFWLEWRLVAAPGDQGALALLDTAHEVVAEGLAEVATGLIRRQEFAEARGLVRRALDAGELPAARGEVLLEFLAVALRREIDRLTAAAVRGSKDESRAVTGLDRAEALLRSVPEGALSPAQRASIMRRIWLAHSKLGFRRLRLGRLDAAAATLFYALGIKEIGNRRQRQVRDALVRTLEAMGEQRVGTVAALVAEGNRATAEAEVARLALLIEQARREGLSADELEVASTRVRQLDRQLDETLPPR